MDLKLIQAIFDERTALMDKAQAEALILTNGEPVIHCPICDEKLDEYNELTSYYGLKMCQHCCEVYKDREE